MKPVGNPFAHLVFVTSQLGGGGAERILVTMARWWAERGTRVSIVVLRADPPSFEYRVPEGIYICRLGLIAETNPVLALGHGVRLWRLRRSLQRLRPSLVITFLDKLNVAVLLALSGSGIPVVATEHLAPWHNRLGFVWETLRRMAYPKAVAVIAPTERISRWFQDRMRGRFETLASPAVDIERRSKAVRREHVLLAAGRLSPQKGFDVLIEASAPILRENPNWRLHIAGEGQARAALAEQIRQHGLESQIRLLGAIPDLDSRMARAEVFVLSSRHEAYPMVLCEALAAGCAVVATDCDTGPREILGQPPAGVLVRTADVDALRKAMGALMADAQARHAYRELAFRRAPELQARVVMPAWDARLKALVA